jgi:hypothetical protein
MIISFNQSSQQQQVRQSAARVLHGGWMNEVEDRRRSTR